jgi:type II secretory pathway component PulF
MSNADLADFATKEKGGLRPGMAGLIAPALAWVFVLAALVFAVPKFEAVFRDFGIDMSGLMMLFVQASHLWLAVLGMVVVLLVVDSIVRDALSRRKDGRDLAGAWSALMLGLPMLNLGLMVFALVATVISLLSKLSG